MIVYYGSYSTTCGKEYLIGYEEGNPNTGDVIVEELEKDEDGWIYKPDIIKHIEKGAKEIREGKKILWKYKTTIPNIEKLKKPINLKKLYYKQFEEKKWE